MASGYLVITTSNDAMRSFGYENFLVDVVDFNEVYRLKSKLNDIMEQPLDEVAWTALNPKRATG